MATHTVSMTFLKSKWHQAVSRGQRELKNQHKGVWNPEHHAWEWRGLISWGSAKREENILWGKIKVLLKWKPKKRMQCNVTLTCWWKALISATPWVSGRDLTRNVWWCTFAWWARAAAVLIYHLTCNWEMCSQCQRNAFRGLCCSGRTFQPVWPEETERAHQRHSSVLHPLPTHCSFF